eukprot:gene16728-biopygen6340
MSGDHGLGWKKEHPDTIAERFAIPAGSAGTGRAEDERVRACVTTAALAAASAPVRLDVADDAPDPSVAHPHPHPHDLLHRLPRIHDARSHRAERRGGSAPFLMGLAALVVEYIDSRRQRRRSS